MINGDWKESSERRIVLDSWEVQTVEVLIEYLHTGNFSWPMSTTIMPEAQPKRKTNAMINDDILSAIRWLSYPPRSGPKDISSLLDCPNLPRADSQQQTWSTCLKGWVNSLPTANDEASLATLLLTHARVYSLADYTLLPDLKALCLQRFKIILIAISNLPTLPSIGDLPKVISFVYANTVKPGEGEEEEPLRRLISTFIALNFSDFDIGGANEVRHFLSGEEDFVVDIWGKIRTNTAIVNGRLKQCEEELAAKKMRLRGQIVA